jgi:hypothetical protein
MINANGHIITRGSTYTLLNKGDTIYTLNSIHLGSALVEAQKLRPVWVNIDDLVKHVRIGYE